MSGANPPCRTAAPSAVWARTWAEICPAPISIDGVEAVTTGITGRTGVTGIVTWGIIGPVMGVIVTSSSSREKPADSIHRR
jgi:hypothetical protein